MGFGYIIAGFVLLLNPVIHVFDLLPDALGFLLMAVGLSKVAYMNGRLSQARAAFLKLAVVELARIFCIVFVPYMDDTALLLFAFVFGVIDLILFFPAVTALFDGLSRIGMKYEGTAVFASREKKRRGAVRVIEAGSRVKTLTLVFYVLRSTATVLPELTSLQMYDYLGTVSKFAVDYRDYKPLFYILLGLVTLIVGTVWLVKLCRYLGGIRHDSAFIDNLKAAYDSEIRVKDGVFVGKRMKAVLVLCIFAAALSFGLYVDGVNILPGILSSAVLASAALLAGKYAKVAYAVLPLALVRSVLSIVGLLYQKVYFLDNRWGIANDKGETAYHHIEEAREMYDGMFALMALESLAAFAAFVLLGIAILRAVRRHLGEFGNRDDSARYSKEAHDRDVSRTMRGKLMVSLLLAAVNFALAGGYLMIMLDFTPIFVVNAAVTVLWVLQTLNTVSAANELLYTPLVNEEL